MIGEFQNIKIQGMASAVPKIVEENKNYESILGTRRTKKQMRLTGVTKRHISGTNQRTSDLCYAAAVPLLDKLGWDKKDVKVLVYITQGPNYKIPSTAFFLQNRLGLSKDCVCFDINLGCSSFNVGVHIVSALMQSCGLSDKGLLLIGDTASKVLRPDEKLNESVIANRMLFGAAGAAIALEKVETSNLKFMTKSDGAGFDAIITHEGRATSMNGTAVFEFAINDVSEDVKTFKNHFDLKEDDIDYYVFHQAQKLILDNIAAICELPDEKELRSLDEYGNTSGTSVPLTVCANKEVFNDQQNVRLYLCGFGVGLSWGSIYTDVPTENILPVIETDEHYDEDKNPAMGLHDKYILVVGGDKPMGESLSHFLNSKSAKVIMAGSDKDKLLNIQEDLFGESHMVVSEQTDAIMFENIISYCKRNDICLNGIVFADSNMAFNLIYEGSLRLETKECLDAQASIVIASNIETLHSQNNETYHLKKQELEDVVAQMNQEIVSESIRVNMVLYDDTKMNLIQITGSGQEWIEKFLQDGCPPIMKKPIYIGQAVTHFLSDDSQYTTGSLLCINR